MSTGWVQHPWATDLSVEVLGVGCRVRSTDLELGRTLGELLHVFPKTSRRADVTLSVIIERDRYQVFDRGMVRIGDGDRDRALMTVMRVVNSEAINRSAFFSIHAGAVARDGRVVAFPGPSGTGKSTFAAACLGVGFDYVSDEALAIDPATKAVIPYPKPLWLSKKARTLVGMGEPQYRVRRRFKSPVLPSELGAAPAEPPLRTSDVIILYDADGPAKLEPLDPNVIAKELLRGAFRRYERAEPWFRLVADLSRTTRGWRLSYHDPTEAAALFAASL